MLGTLDWTLINVRSPQTDWDHSSPFLPLPFFALDLPLCCIRVVEAKAPCYLVTVQRALMAVEK